ncbi:2-oxoacid:acceptor oxidoreductase family protein [Desulfoferrobacter suflitae]|uniref:2-oxoacid:acceptor oxidoreductase family protein n=1 Tax=Desulfoferrobacter suflitae TaxID=2865782 RepID=UPI0021645051|nr:2-oxoacid:acceptor oxidoreductase family protein [Desulfoferrobacter suflitae]MCK8604003.1 2-oxoacid:acceptor oxidoreductase family protein [Desulfoferrobacter suflitae]
MRRNCVEVRWHGRGGQGAVTAASILAEAAYYDGYKGVTAAPFFGAERRGAPIIATNRLGREPIRTFSLVEYPDVVVVLDATLLKVVNVTAGIRPDGIVLINSGKPPEALGFDPAYNVATTNASQWAREAGLIVSGTVLFNTAILGGFARATGLVSLESIERALRSHFSGQAAERNVQGARLAYEGTTTLRKFALACA